MPPIRFGSPIPPALPIRMQLRLGMFMEKLGYDTLWFPDHMLFPDFSPAPDPFTIMAAMAAKTKRVQLGTAVSDPHRVHPAVLAQKLATLDQLSQGRVILGLGTGEAMNLDPYGIPWDRKVARLREVITILRGLLDSPEPFSFEGDFFTLRKARLGVRPYKKRRIPIYVAALGPMMQKLCGQLADGWFPVVVPHQFYREYFGGVAAAARAIGRDPETFDRVATVALTVGDLARAELEAIARPYALTLVWPVALERLGIPWNPPEHLKETHYISVNPCDEEHLKRYQELQQWMPLEMIEKFVYSGPLEEIARVLKAFIDQGVTHFSIQNASLDPLTTTAQLCSQVYPRFTGKSPTLTAQVTGKVFPMARKLGLMPRVPGPRDWGLRDE